LGMFSMYFIVDPLWLLLPMVFVGMAWASILSIPYTLLSEGIDARRLGFYLGVFNLFIVMPQIMGALVLGPVIKNLFANQGVMALMLAGVSFVLAGLFTLRLPR